MGLQDQLDAIDAQITAVLAEVATNPKAIVDYREGDVEVKNSQRLKLLLEARKELLDQGPATATAKVINFDFDIDEWGVDRGEYES
jgi:hypothetical protein